MPSHRSDFTLTKTGSASGEDADFYGTNAGILANNQANVTIESGSTWNLTADSYVTSLDNAGSINLNGHTLYVDGKAYTAQPAMLG